MRRHNAWESRKLLQKDPPHTTKLPSRPVMKQTTQGTRDRKSEQSSLPSTCVYWWAVGTAGHCSQRVRAQGGRRHQLLQLWPLGSHSEPCHSSSSQTMRVIFSQCYNTSQLASVQGGSPLPSSPPRQQAGQPAQPMAYNADTSTSLFVYLVLAQLLLITPQNCNPVKGKPKKSEFDQRAKS